MLCHLKILKQKKYPYFNHFILSPSAKVYRLINIKKINVIQNDRAFLSTSFKMTKHRFHIIKCNVQGGLTVEAALVVPFFTLVFCILLHLFQVFSFYFPLQNAMDTTAASVAQNAYLIQIGEEQWSKISEKYSIEDNRYRNQLKDGLKSGWVRQQILSYANLKDASAYTIAGRANGIAITQCDYDVETGAGEIQLEYKIQLPYIPATMTTFHIAQKTVFRGWVGKELGEGMYEGENLVYVTEYGEVYHTDRQCSYLTVKVEKVKKKDTDKGDGDKEFVWEGKTYETCHRCKNAQYEYDAYVWITKYGDCFHKTSQCSALQRVVFVKDKKNLEGVRSCSKCVEEGTKDGEKNEEGDKEDKEKSSEK